MLSSSGWPELGRMRVSPASVFQDTVSRCFANVLETMLGRAVRMTILEVLESNGIAANEISEKFSGTFDALTRFFGTGSKVLEHKILVEIYHEYSQKVNFTFFDKLEVRLVSLKEIVVNDHLYPIEHLETV